MRLYEVIKKPVLTEKTYAQIETLNKYTFEVAKDANKTEIAQAFHKIFSVKPLAVNIINVKPQAVRTGTKFPGVSSFVKKAVITLPAGTKLNIFGDKDAAAEAEEKAKSEKEGKVDKAEAKAEKVEAKVEKAEAKAEKAVAKTKTKPIDEEEHAKRVAKSATKPIAGKTKPIDGTDADESKKHHKASTKAGDKE